MGKTEIKSQLEIRVEKLERKVADLEKTIRGQPEEKSDLDGGKFREEVMKRMGGCI